MSLPDVVVLFGASGFIGRNIVQALAGRVELLVGVNSSGRPVPGCTLTVPANAMDAIPPLPSHSAIVHVAAFRYFASRFAHQQADIVAANLSLTDVVYRFALQRGISEVRIASSSAVYPAVSPVLDDTMPIDLNLWPHEGEAAYAWSKRWGEIVAELWRRRAGVNTISFRLTNPYGAFDTLDESEAHVATAFVIRALRDTPDFEMRGDPTAERDFVFGGDVAAAFVASLGLQGVTEAVNCAAGQTTRIDELARIAMRAAGRERPLRTNPPPAGANPGVRVRRATAARVRALLPDLPAFRSLEDGMRETVAWYRDALR
jgi:nucleoside-diphosphate-sugar epimerase